MKSTALSKLGLRTANPPISWLMNLTLDRPKLISLAAGFTDNPSLPVEETRAVLLETLRYRSTALPALQYGSTMGDLHLRRLTAERISAQDSRAAQSPLRHAYENFLITSGSQQLLYLVTECLCDTGDIVLVEDPTYFVYLGLAQSHGLRCRGVRLAEDGLDLDHLERVLATLKRRDMLHRVKMLYVVSYYQNPTGVTTSFARKVGVLELLRVYERAAGHPIYLVEDAAYRELRFDGEDVPSALAAKSSHDRVIYAGTYSKPFSTGMRVGFGYLPESLFAVVNRIKSHHDFGSSNLLQQLLVRALASGRYEKHLAVLQRRYTRKANAMVRAMENHFPNPVHWRKPRGGLYCWAQLPRSLKSGPKSRFFQTALAKDVLYVPGELCYADDPTRPKPNHEMRLSFGGATESEIRRGIQRLGKVLRSF